MSNIVKGIMRRKDVDVMRGLCMLSVILGHSIIRIDNPINVFILSFHMLCFFFISGLCYHESDKSLINIMFGKIKTIGWPLLTFSILAIILAYPQYILGAQKDYNLEKMVLGIFTGQIPAKGFWFVYDLLWVSILYPAVYRLCKKPIFIMVISLILIFVCEANGNINNHIIRIMLGFFFYSVGVAWHLYIERYTERLKSPILWGAIIITACLTLFVSRLNDPVFLFKYEWGNMMLCILSSLLGSIMLYCISKKIQTSKFFEYVGVNSIVFLFFQFYPLTIPMYLVMKNDWNTPIVEYPIIVIFFIISVGACFIISILLNKYAPFVVKCPKK